MFNGISFYFIPQTYGIQTFANWPLNDHVDGSKIVSIPTMTNSLSCDQYEGFLKLLYQQLKIVMIWGQ